MAAVLDTQEINGTAPGALTALPSPSGRLTFQMIDAAAEDESNLPMRPPSGLYYAYWKSVYLNAISSPPTEINNVKFFSDGIIPWTGVTLYVGNQTPLVANYVQAIGTEGQTGVEMITGHGGISAKTIMNTYSSSETAKSIDGSISTPNVGAITKLLVLQCNFSINVVPGDTGTTELTWVYDEI